MTINLNEDVMVWLTKRGEDIALQAKLRVAHVTNVEPHFSRLLFTQLHTLMVVFGPHVQLGF